jgi:hypothetical protein
VVRAGALRRPRLSDRRIGHGRAPSDRRPRRPIRRSPGPGRPERLRSAPCYFTKRVAWSPHPHGRLRASPIGAGLCPQFLVGGGPMHLNQASIIRREPATSAVLRFQSRISDRAIIEQAAQALFEFVFSVCNRLDGKHHWNECDEETKEGFRAEAAVVVKTVYPLLSPQPLRRPAL